MRFIVVCSTRQWLDDALWLITRSLEPGVQATVYCLCLRREVLGNSSLDKFGTRAIDIVCIEASDGYSMIEPVDLLGRIRYALTAASSLKKILPDGPIDCFLTDNPSRVHDLLVRLLCEIRLVIIFRHGARSLVTQWPMLLKLRRKAKQMLIFCSAALIAPKIWRLSPRATELNFEDHGHYNLKLTKIAHEVVSQGGTDTQLLLTSGIRRYTSNNAEEALFAQILDELKRQKKEYVFIKSKLDEPEFTTLGSVTVLPQEMPLLDAIREIRPSVIFCHCSSTAVLEALLLGIEVQVYGIEDPNPSAFFSNYTDDIRSFLLQDARDFQCVGVAGTVKLIPTDPLVNLIREKFFVADLAGISLQRFLEPCRR